MSPGARLRARLAARTPLVLPGVYDSFSAMMAERAGFEAIYLSGASVAYSQLGRPDLGFIDAGDVVATAGRICERVPLPLIVDGDTGFGGVLNVERLMGRLAMVGVGGVQIEDQEFPKRCGHLGGKRLVPAVEMAAKLRAARRVAGEDGPVVVARTDAIAVEGLDAACERAERYLDAGAEVLFIEAPETVEQIRLVSERFASRVPLLLNQVEGGRTPLIEFARCADLNIRVLLFPGGLFRAVARTMERYFASLCEHGSNAPFREHMLDFSTLNGLLGTDAELARADSYADAAADGDG